MSLCNHVKRTRENVRGERILLDNKVERVFWVLTIIALHHCFPSTRISCSHMACCSLHCCLLALPLANHLLINPMRQLHESRTTTHQLTKELHYVYVFNFLFAFSAFSQVSSAVSWCCQALPLLHSLTHKLKTNLVSLTDCDYHTNANHKQWLSDTLQKQCFHTHHTLSSPSTPSTSSLQLSISNISNTTSMESAVLINNMSSSNTITIVIGLTN